MEDKTKTDLVLGVTVLVACSMILFVWIPADVDTGIFEKVRRRTVIGDSFAPVIATSILALGGIMLIIEALRRPGRTRLSFHSLALAAGLFVVFAVAMAIMRWAGPLAVEMFAGPEATGYRALRDTAPWKHIGFITGGTFLVTTIISVIEHRLTWRSIVIGLTAAIAILLIYDLPFDDLLVPPNGDV